MWLALNCNRIALKTTRSCCKIASSLQRQCYLKSWRLKLLQKIELNLKLNLKSLQSVNDPQVNFTLHGCEAFVAIDQFGKVYIIQHYFIN